MPNITAVTQWFKTLATHIRTKIGVDVVEIGTADKSLIATGADFTLKNTKVGGKSQLDGQSGVDLEVNGNRIVEVILNMVNVIRHIKISSGQRLYVKNVGNTQEGSLFMNVNEITLVDRNGNNVWTAENGYNRFLGILPQGDSLYPNGLVSTSWLTMATKGLYIGYRRSVDATITVANTDYFVEVTNLTANRIVELPSNLINKLGWMLGIKCAINGGFNLNVETQAGETIEGQANYVFAASDGTIWLQSDGTNMRIMGFM